nr:response regulator [Lachnospiraceae bacterium]
MYILQISCIFILCFLMVLFILEKKFEKKTDKLFLGLMIISGFGILLEIAAMYTMCNVGEVSPLMYKTVHRAYLTLILTFSYMLYVYKSVLVKEEIGVASRSWSFINISQIILYLGIFVLPLSYKVTEQGEYVYGPGMWVVYVGAAAYLFFVLAGYCEHSKKIEKDIILPLVFGVACGMVICFYYMCVPTSNLACLGILIINIGTYISWKSRRTLPQGESCMNEDSEEKNEAEESIVFKAPEAKVLVVDDSMINRKVLVNLLAKTEMKMDEASGGKECLALVMDNQYDLIFMDHLMPDMDGIETLKALQNDKLCSGTPVVAMTANAENMSEEEYKECGFAALVPKPVSPQQLNKVSYDLLDKKLITYSEHTELPKEEEAVTEPNKKAGDELTGIDLEGLPPIDGLDYNYAAIHFVDRDAFLDTVQFLSTVMLHDAEELDAYFEAVDTQEGCLNFKIKVHSMKNSAMTVGIVPLAGLAKTLEDAASESDMDVIHSVYPVFLSKWKKYQVLLGQKFAAKDGEKLPGDVTSDEIKELFRSLRNASEEMDIDEMDRIMGLIDAYVFPEEYEEDLSKIRMAVMNFEIEYLQAEGLAKFI